uniref:snRNA-activating protein complex subunit 2 n=1 Tax=Neogobius melanostomus TaxID=47308 RepID=A0A8C6UKF4_9GOBI
MKPPPRKRIRKNRELLPVPEPRGKLVCKWPHAEKKRLLSALTQLSPGHLDPERVREHLPTRSAAEINSILDALKEKVVLFAKTKQSEERRAERRARKPLEMWIQEATAVTGGVDESLSSAFTQMLTVTTIEPRTHPPSPAQPLSKGSSSAPSASPLLRRSPAADTSPPVTGGLKKTPQRHHTPATTQSSSNPMTHVSFEKIYHYLSALSKPSEQAKLTPMESAIVLDLLMSLPEELLLLDCDQLSQHLSQVYLSLSSSADSTKTHDSSKGVKRHHPPTGPDCQQPHPALEDSSPKGAPTRSFTPHSTLSSSQSASCPGKHKPIPLDTAEVTLNVLPRDVV